MVFVDELRQWPTTIRCFKAGSCHLTADTLDELHAFAARLGLRREWFQEHRLAPHYDLTKRRRDDAVRLGAVFMPARTQAIRRRQEKSTRAETEEET
jgi:hypothetical protein